MLSEEITDKLDKPLDPSRVKHRAGGGGMSLAYLKGHNVIDQANDLFGYGNWGYDILLVEQCNVLGESGDIIGGYYAARVRLTVRDCIPITEEGVCPIQDSRNPRARIDAHDMARKGAVTDAMKRAFRCYGDQFGNSLYDTDLIDGQPGTEKQPASNNQNRPTAPRPGPSTGKTYNQPAPAPQAPKAVAAPTPIPAPKTLNREKASDQQINAITRMAGLKGWDELELAKRLKELYGVPLLELNKSDAGNYIQLLQQKA